MDRIDAFLIGATAMAFAVAGLYFLRFWRQTHDRLFAIFAVAFWLLGLARFGLVVTDATNEAYSPMYLVRLLAYVLIVLAILDKNYLRGNGPPSDKQREESLPGR